MLFALALIPVAGLLFFIYIKDKNEKEPIGLLTGLFFAGMGTVISAIILELIGMLIVNALIPNNPVINNFTVAVFVVGPVEELGKFLVLRLITWKNKNFNYSYDAIVYAVFVSLGFAALENIEYVFLNGVGTALLRMFTAVPAHTCFAVFMGFFYSKAKYAHLTNNKKDYTKYMLLTIFPSIILHGLYDGIIMSGGSSEVPLVSGLSILLWLGFVIVLFVLSFLTVLYSSKHDFCIVTMPNNVQTIYKPEVIGSWKCICGHENSLNFCNQCGHQRPVGDPWNCPKCGTLSFFNFCGNCGCARQTVPANGVINQAAKV